LLALFWLLFLRREAPDRGRMLRHAAAMATLLVAIGTAHWDWSRLTAGTGNYFGQKPAAAASSGNAAKGANSLRIIFRDENVQGGFTTVMEERLSDGPAPRTIRTLLTNGKFQGDDDVQGKAQFGLGAIPSLFVDRYDRVLLIGLGTGHSAATLRRVGFRNIDIAEFSPGIVRAANECFRGLNENILSSPGVHLMLEDGRNVLLADAHTRYDVITLEISSVWFAGATNLYAKEFYQLAHARLRPDGVLQQWVQLHHIGPRELASELATVRAVFPYVGLWFYGGQGMIVAADRPLETTDVARAELPDRFSSPRVVEELEAARALSPAQLERLIRENPAPLNTDHNRWIEYASPRYEASSYDWMAHNLRFLAQYR
jgi:spermidine synthase